MCGKGLIARGVIQMILKDKVSIITGGSGGIGKAIASAFVGEGSSVLLTSRTRSQLESVKVALSNSSSTIEIFEADVSNVKQVKDLVEFTLERFGTIDILVNCAGIYGPIGLITDIDCEEWIQAVNINLFGTFLCMKAVLPTMIKNRKGKIINFSGGGATSPFPRFSAYAASKCALVRLTETIAEEVKEHNIDINAIAPGPVNTRLLDEVLQAGEAAGRNFLEKSIKQKKEGGVPPEKAAALAVFLASSKSDGLTGRLISAVWDDWQNMEKRIPEIMKSNAYTLRRVVDSR